MGELHSEFINCADNKLVEKDYLSNIQAKIEYLENIQIEGAIFRSRAQWVKEGEHNTKYFFSLEK